MFDQNQVVCGFPIQTVHNMLRSFPCSFCLDDVCKRLRVSQDKSRELIKELSSMGYIQKGEGQLWEMRATGCALRDRDLLKPLGREKAHQMLDDFLGRVREHNRNNSSPHSITYVGLFGSLSKGAEEIKHIELAVDTSRKEQVDDEQMDLDAYRRSYNNTLKFITDENPYIRMISDLRDQLNIHNIFPTEIYPRDLRGRQKPF